MPKAAEGYPTRDEVLNYLEAYEKRYALPIRRPVHVDMVVRDGAGFEVLTDQETYTTKAVVSATGTWSSPYIPDYPGRERFKGRQLHSARYEGPESFGGQRVLVIGGGNSGAQILAEVSKVAETTLWSSWDMTMASMAVRSWFSTITAGRDGCRTPGSEPGDRYRERSGPRSCSAR